MEMQVLTRLLHETNCSCVIGNREIRTFSRPGIIDIYDLLYCNWNFLSGSCVADRVVGKAAASLLILGGVKRVYADVISCQAYSMFEDHNLEAEYKDMVGFIWNRHHTDPCLLEKLCCKENDLMKILDIIDRFIRCKMA